MHSLEQHCLQVLDHHRQHDLLRSRLLHSGAQQPILTINQQPYLSFCSNDYLGLANHPALKTAIQQAVSEYGVGSGASHLISGHSQPHQILEQQLAKLTQRPQALVFSTGYMANLGIITSLLGRSDAIFLDKWNHASLVDAALLCRAKIYRYPHQDLTSLEKLLAKTQARHKLIVTDGVFSMDGDLADLPRLSVLARQYDAWLMVDDAHGFGVLGAQGGGTVNAYGLSKEDVPILMGTLGKAYGVFGAFVAGSQVFIDALIQLARTYIYTTALPPILACAAQRSVELAQMEAWRREFLHTQIAYFRCQAQQAGLALTDSITPIQPLIIGTAKDTLALSQKLFAAGILVTAIRPPTVPANTARLRITLSASHTQADIDRLVTHLKALI